MQEILGLTARQGMESVWATHENIALRDKNTAKGTLWCTLQEQHVHVYAQGPAQWVCIA